MEVYREAVIKATPKKENGKKAKWLSEKALQIVENRREDDDCNHEIKGHLQYSLKSGRLIPPVPFFFLKITLAIRGFFVFPYKL